MKPFNAGDRVVVSGMGKCRDGTFLQTLPEGRVEYKCDYNKTYHNVAVDRVKHKPKHRISRGEQIGAYD